MARALRIEYEDAVYHVTARGNCMKNIKLIVFIISLVLIPTVICANGTEDYLILQDIAQYKLTKGLLFRGKMVGAEPKVSRVGNDVNGFYTSYETSYAGGEGYSAPKVEIRVYELTQWLLHEVERGFRFGDYEEDMTPSRFRNIGGNYIFYSKLGGGGYRWISNNIVIDIEYTDLYQQKSEPMEVVEAYLAKFPSTISAMTIDQAHNEIWIKDEMDRRLWLGGKWMGEIKTAGDLDKLRDVVKNLNIFLDYREKYFGIETGDEKNALFTAQQSKNKAAIEAKLNDYYKWWNENKDKPINL